MLSGADDGEVRVWDMSTWQGVHVIQGRGSGINSIVSLGTQPLPGVERDIKGSSHLQARIACASDDGHIYTYSFTKDQGWCVRSAGGSGPCSECDTARPPPDGAAYRTECAPVAAHKDVVWALGPIAGLVVSASEDKVRQLVPEGRATHCSRA